MAAALCSLRPAPSVGVSNVGSQNTEQRRPLTISVEGKALSVKGSSVWSAFVTGQKLQQCHTAAPLKKRVSVVVKAQAQVEVEVEEVTERFRLENLSPQPGSRKRNKRKSRGIAAGQGASCGFGMRGQKSRSGELTAAAYFVFALSALLFVDSCMPKITQRTFAPYFLTTPFLLSAVVTSIAGYICVPLLKKIKVSQIFRKEGPTAHLVKSGTPTMGGLFFLPVGLAVAALFNRSSAVEVHGVTIMTIVYAGIGLLDDSLALMRKHNYGLPGRIKLMLQVVAGVLFFLWLTSVNVSSSYVIKHEVLLPAPFGHMRLGKWYMGLTAFCCAAMSNGVNLTDGLDGLAGGTVAAAFIGMSVAVLPSSPALAVFGSSMAGACFGFLVHNRHKATVFMGDTGSLALGGALAAMAACSGMFFPLFIASGVFVVETVSVMGQVFYFQLTKRLYGQGRRWLRMAPFHHHLELLGLSETRITILAYGVGIILSIVAAYTGLLLSM